MKLRLSLLLMFLLPVSGYSLKAQSLQVQMDQESTGVPIVTLEGTGSSDILIDKYYDNDGVHVHQEFTYSMANVNSGNVSCVGTCMITSSDPGYEWNVGFSGSSTYQIKSYGNLAVVSFNHRLNKSNTELSLIRATWCNAGYITSSGKSYVVSDDIGGFYLFGRMAGSVVGKNNSKTLTNIKYNSPFTQTFDLSTSQNFVNWYGDYNLSSNAKGVLSGSGSLTFGSINDPVDTVEQKVKGTLSKSGVFSWTTTSVSNADKKVKITIKNTSTDVIDGKNNITAAAQSRKF